MALNNDKLKLLDETSWQLLEALQTNARLSFSELGRMVKLSSPAAAERIRRLEEAGVILGYQAQLNAKEIGLPLSAIIQLTTSPEKYPQIIALLHDLPEVLECHHVTGNYSLFLKVIASSISHLEELIGKLSLHGKTSTSIILSSPINARTINSQSFPRI
ncbi:MAG: Lrp/AsnC family transcriptional regulator [Oscillatoria sp. PMC 1051.18]|nr:Lrp/AsnC family transcriptional regulator [Oscillatoria sp. PMC 1050.18]MEC5029356.1 Lrp/AsnC family transcriptional regulator [Oscillatoria sp. PMC 1051.18]